MALVAARVRGSAGFVVVQPARLSGLSFLRQCVFFLFLFSQSWAGLSWGWVCCAFVAGLNGWPRFKSVHFTERKSQANLCILLVSFFLPFPITLSNLIVSISPYSFFLVLIFFTWLFILCYIVWFLIFYFFSLFAFILFVCIFLCGNVSFNYDLFTPWAVKSNCVKIRAGCVVNITCNRSWPVFLFLFSFLIVR